MLGSSPDVLVALRAPRTSKQSKSSQRQRGGGVQAIPTQITRHTEVRASKAALGPHRRTKRPRRQVSPATLWLLRPFFRHYLTRDAWILRVVGQRGGPVIVSRGRLPNVEDPPPRSEDLGRQRGRFARPPQRTRQVDEGGEVSAEPHTLQPPDP